MNRMKILDFINELRNSDGYIYHIYSKGGCYKFHVLLSKMYMGATPYIGRFNDHIITKYKGKYYDIHGEVENINGFRELTCNDIPMVSKWSFHENNLLRITECPNCDEPIVY